MCLFSRRGYGDCLIFLLFQVMWLWTSLEISPCGPERGLHRATHSGIMPKCAFHFPKFYQIFSRKAPLMHKYFYFSNILFCWLPNFCLSGHSKVTLTDDFWVWAFIISFLDPLWVAYSYFCLHYTGILIFFWMIYGNFLYIQIVISY